MDSSEQSPLIQRKKPTVSSSSTSPSTAPKPKAPKRVLIVGAGAAGMSCAWHLSQHPDRFAVTLVEASAHCGGQAFAIPLDPQRHHAGWLNQGVQGGSYIFHHTLTQFARQGYRADPVKLQVSFGKGDGFWNNVYPTRLLERLQSEVRRFQTLLRAVRWLEVLVGLVPMAWVLRAAGFSRDFVNRIALPMVALFLGTGNATPEVPSIIMERLTTSETYGMWYPGDTKRVASNLPPMVVFPNFSDFYEDYRKDLEKRGAVVRLSTEVTRVVRRDQHGVVVRLIQRTPRDDGHNPQSAWASGSPSGDDADAGETQEEYDELVLCVLADTAKRLLTPTISIREKQILGSAKFSDDITVTHTDSDYMAAHYEPFYNGDQVAPALASADELASARTSYRPMYYIKEYEQDPSKLEMSFDCTNYQAQFPPDVPFNAHVFQTIFLNRSRDSALWDREAIDPEKVIRADWWHQLCHSYTHYLFVVPFVWLLQGHRRTRYAAAWTMLNAHEVAVMSGIAAAVDLGATYPADLAADGFAFLCFRLYYLLAYGKWYWSRGLEKDRVGESWGKGPRGSVYCGPGVSSVERSMWKKDQAKNRKNEVADAGGSGEGDQGQ